MANLFPLFVVLVCAGAALGKLDRWTLEQELHDTNKLKPEQTLKKLKQLLDLVKDEPNFENSELVWVKKLVDFAKPKSEDCKVGAFVLEFYKPSLGIEIKEGSNLESYIKFYRSQLKDFCFSYNLEYLRRFDASVLWEKTELAMELKKRILLRHYYEDYDLSVDVDKAYIDGIFVPDVSDAVAQMISVHVPELEPDSTDMDKFVTKYDGLIGDLCLSVDEQIREVFLFYAPIMNAYYMDPLTQHFKDAHLALEWLTFEAFCIGLNKEKQRFVEQAYEFWRHIKLDNIEVPKVDVLDDDKFKERVQEQPVDEPPQGLFKKILSLFNSTKQ